MRNITCISLIMSLLLLLSITTLQNSFSLINTKSPFSESNAKIKNISTSTSDDKYFVNLQFGPETVRKGELSFFMVNLFNNSGDKQIRMRHVGCDFIILKDEIELYKMSTKYGEPLFYAINGAMIVSFPFSESGNYTISIEVAGQYSIPITPVFANFSAIVSPTSDGSLKIKLST